MSSVSAILCLSTCIQADVVPVWIGKPGTGKTAVLTQMGEAMGFDQTIVLSATNRESTDIGGLPFPCREDGCFDPLPPRWALTAHQKPCLVVFDECNRGPKSVENSMLRVWQERHVGDVKLHPGTRIVNTANPSTVDSGARDIGSAAANRMYHEHQEIEVDAWHNWMLGGSGALTGIAKLPANWQADYLPLGRRDVVSFLNVKRNLESAFPKDLTQQGGPWPSRRSWANAATLWAAGGLAQKNLDLGIKLVAGCVGEGPAMEFVSYVKDADLPDPRTILNNPSAFTLPRRMDQHFAVLGSVCALARQIGTVASMKAAEEVLVIANEAGARDTASASLALLMNGAQIPGWSIGPTTARVFMPTLQAAGWVGGKR